MLGEGKPADICEETTVNVEKVTATTSLAAKTSAVANFHGVQARNG